MTFNFIDLLESLRSRLRLVILVAGVIFLLVAAVTFIQPRKYLASSSLLIDLSQTDQGAGAADTTPESSAVIDSIVGTQVDIIKSGLVIDEVARRAGMIDPADPQASLQQAETKINKNLTVDSGRQSNVLTISYLDHDAENSARIANLFADIFIAKQVELRAAPARGNAKWFDARTAEVGRRYEAAQKRLADFQRARGILGVERMDLEAEKLKSLSTELATAGAEAAAARSKAGSSAMPEVASALSVQGIEQQVATQAAHVSELAKTLGPNHPEMKAATAQLQGLQAALGSARSVQATSLSAASSAAIRREADLRARVAGQQQQMIAMSGVQDQLVVLQRDVDAARATYDTVRQRFNDAALKSEISQVNASVLDYAAAPLLPAKPNVILWLIGGLVFGVMGGVAAALALELIRPRVRSATGLASATDLPVIADFSPVQPGRLGRLLGTRTAGEFA